MAILERKTKIPADRDEEVIFVGYDGQIGIGDFKLSHDKLALKDKLYYPESEDRGKLRVDDGGLIIDDGEKLIIPKYFTTTTMPIAILNGWRDGGDESKIKKEIRQKTGALIASITSRKVEVQHADGTVEVFSA